MVDPEGEVFPLIWHFTRKSIAAAVPVLVELVSKSCPNAMLCTLTGFLMVEKPVGFAVVRLHTYCKVFKAAVASAPELPASEMLVNFDK